MILMRCYDINVLEKRNWKGRIYKGGIKFIHHLKLTNKYFVFAPAEKLIIRSRKTFYNKIDKQIFNFCEKRNWQGRNYKGGALMASTI